MHIKVKPKTGRDFELDIEPNETVEQIKEKVELEEGIPPQEQLLHYRAKGVGFNLLDDRKTSADYGLSDGSVIHVFLQIGRGAAVTYGDLKKPLGFVHNATLDIEELKQREFGRRDAVYCEPFVLVLNGSYREFRLGLFPNSSFRGKQGVFVALEPMNRDMNGIEHKVSVRLSDQSYLVLQDWNGDVTYFGQKICKMLIASNLEELETKGLLLDGKSILSLVVELKIRGSQFYTKFETPKSNLGNIEIRFYGIVYKELSKRRSKDTDYHIVCEESNKRFPCHKLIVRRRSPYFENLFSSHPGFGQQEVLEVGWGPEVAEEVLHFIYTDEASQKFDSVPLEDLVEVAGMLELKKLLMICEKSLIARIDKTNAWDYLSIADTHEMKSLKEKALCIVTEEAGLAEKLVDDAKKKELRKEVMEFLLKRGRAQALVQ